jgi:Uncharacterized homolog of PSP1
LARFEKMEQMKNIVGVKLKKRGKTYNFDAGDIQLRKNESIIVDTGNRLTIGNVETSVKPVHLGDLPYNLKKIVRKATEEDLKIREENQNLEKEAFRICLAKIKIETFP